MQATFDAQNSIAAQIRQNEEPDDIWAGIDGPSGWTPSDDLMLAEHAAQRRGALRQLQLKDRQDMVQQLAPLLATVPPPPIRRSARVTSNARKSTRGSVSRNAPRR